MELDYFVVKVGCEGNLWRVKIHARDLTYAKIKDSVERTVPPRKGQTIRYKDDEGDMCVLTPETFDDALDISRRNKGLMRLDVVHLAHETPFNSPFEAPANLHDGPCGLSALQATSNCPSPTSSYYLPFANIHSPSFDHKHDREDQKLSETAPTTVPDDFHKPKSAESYPAHFHSTGSSQGFTAECVKNATGDNSATTNKNSNAKASGTPPELVVASDKIYAPKPVLRMFLCLNEMNMLTPRMVTSVIVSFIPLMIQRCSRHTDRLSYNVYNNYKCFRPTLQSMLLAITHIPVLHEFIPLLQAIVNSGPYTPEIAEFGQWFVGLLKSFSTLCFDTQVQVLLMVVPSWIPCIQAAVNCGHFDVPPTPKQQVTHKGVACDGCGVSPIVGPRFKCQVCDCDLCGECYPNKSNLHAELHDFVCVLRPGREVSGATKVTARLAEATLGLA
ncbi:hypothetical protein FOL47_003730 [Perkinsus chesapeaki]|uniref:ZZ-type domain-containing protein n=1 Tax=Perkinsus chesapeaki TaxID=330153 RepID=A0A7J6M6D7_PERCH|nr:hypothetical protein FOL47_003730 [Perkinsus chesapeaki]